ncbi:MAG: hypothetical protein FWE22_00785 [Firmicutes bacterium]|nr:hypothetical protein [Bacillota bacterium]
MYTGLTGALKVGGINIAYISGWNLEETTEIIEVSKVGSLVKGAFPTFQRWSASSNGAVSMEDDGQRLLYDARRKGEKIELTLYLKNEGDDLRAVYFRGECYVESLGIDISFEGVAQIAISVRGLGALKFNIRERVIRRAYGYDELYAIGEGASFETHIHSVTFVGDYEYDWNDLIGDECLMLQSLGINFVYNGDLEIDWDELAINEIKDIDSDVSAVSCINIVAQDEVENINEYDGCLNDLVTEYDFMLKKTQLPSIGIMYPQFRDLAEQFSEKDEIEIPKDLMSREQLDSILGAVMEVDIESDNIKYQVVKRKNERGVVQ